MKYIEQNPLRAKLVARAEDWAWGSLNRRLVGTPQQKLLVSPWIIEEPKKYLADVNQTIEKNRLDSIRTSVLKGAPLGTIEWRLELIESLQLGYTTRGVGRPKNGS